MCEHHHVDEMVIVDGMERLFRPGGEGTPAIGEFVLGEIGCQLGTSKEGARRLVADALDIRFRHPRLFQALLGGEVEVWHVRALLRTPGLRELSAEAAGAVDRRLAGVLGRASLGALCRLVEGWVVEADPVAAVERGPPSIV